MALPTLTMGGTDVLPYVQAGSMTVKLNTLDVALNNPSAVPVLGQAVVMTNPTWSGVVTAVTTSDLTELKGAKFLLVSVSATNDDEAAASAAPFNLSDTPNGTTTFGYRGLAIQKSQNQDGTSTTNGSCTIYREGLWPAMTFTLTSANQGYSAQSFSVQNVTVTWLNSTTPEYEIEFGDPIVTMSVWLNESAQDFILPIDSTKITDGAVTTPKLAANAVTADKIEAGSITADKLAATLILASTIKTTDSGARVEIDTAGIRNYDSSENLLVNIPTNDDPVSVTGQIEASSLVSTTTAELRGSTSFTTGSSTTLESAVADPAAAPVLTSTLEQLTLTTTPTYLGHGLCFDSAGDAGGATATYWVGGNPNTGSSQDVAYEYNATTGALLRTITTTGSITTTTTTYGSTSHYSDSAQATSGSSDSQVARNLTMPRDGRITKVAAYFAGYLGDCTARVAVWDSSYNLLRNSSAFTATSETFANGNSNLYNKSLTSALEVSSGTSLRVGFLRTSSGDGFQWDRYDSAGTTYIGDGLFGDMTTVTTDGSKRPNIYFTYEYDTDTRLEGTIGKIIGVARQGTYIWVLDEYGYLFRYSQSTLAYVDKFDLSSYIAGTKANAGLFWDGTNLIITTATGVTGTDQVRFIKVTTGGAYSSTVSATGLSINGSTSTVRGGYYDGTEYWVAITGTVNGVYAFTASTGANLANRHFGTSTEISSGIAYRSTFFRSWANTTPTKINTFTNWDWTTESPVYWVGYTWYDSAGTTHETILSPRASTTLGRRRRLTVTTPAIPVGGADDPDKCRIYMVRNATELAITNYKLQATDALTSRTFSTYTGAGAADPASNNYASGTAATLASAATGWTLKGTGVINRTGTAFPSAPATNDTYFRSDLGMEFFYDGTRWLSTQLFTYVGGNYTGATTYALNLSATQTSVQRLNTNINIGTDIWLIDIITTNVVNTGGSALSASHKWVATVQKLTTANAATSIGTLTIDSGSSAPTWHTRTSSVNALLGTTATYPTMRVDWAMTGTPGTLSINPGFMVTYRIVQT